MTQSIGELINSLYETREGLREIGKQEKTLKDTYHDLEQTLLEKLDEQGTSASRSDKASVSITEQEIAQLEDFDAFIDYIAENQAWHLLQRRLASRATLEELQQLTDEDPNAELPGVRCLTQRKLGLRTL